MTPLFQHNIDLKPRSFGELFSLSLRMLFNTFGTTMGIVLLVLVPLLIFGLAGNLINLIQIGGWTTNALGSQTVALIASLCSSIIVLALSLLFPWMEGALTHNVIERSLGRNPGVRESYRAARPQWLSLLGSYFVRNFALFALIGLVATLAGAGNGIANSLVGLTGGLGSDFSIIAIIVTTSLCVPVLLVVCVFTMILAINWLFRAPIGIGEGAGAFDSLSRSSQLAKGDRLRLIGRMLPVAFLEFVLIGLPTWLITSASGASAFRFLSGELSASAAVALGGWQLIGSLLALLLTPFAIIYITLNYLDLRIRKENLVALLENRTKPDEVQQAVVVPQPAPSLSLESAPYTAPLTPAQKIGVIYGAMRTQGESPRLLTELGKAYQQVGDLGGALDALTKARALAPYDANIAFNLATLYRDRKDLNSAREMMAEYMRLETDLNDLAQIRANPNFRDLI
jgi:hypothetical protein